MTPGQARLLKFLVVGGSGVPVNLACVYLTTFVLRASLGVGARDAMAYIIGIVVSILTNFLLNNAWTWADRAAAAGSFLARLAKFYLVSAVAAVIQFGTAVLLSQLLRGTQFFGRPLHGEYRPYHVVAPLAGIILGLAINFVANNLWTFRRQRQEKP